MIDEEKEDDDVWENIDYNENEEEKERSKEIPTHPETLDQRSAFIKLMNEKKFGQDFPYHKQFFNFLIIYCGKIV